MVSPPVFQSGVALTNSPFLNPILLDLYLLCASRLIDLKPVLFLKYPTS